MKKTYYYSPVDYEDRRFLVQRVCDGEQVVELMTANELINYIDFQDIVTEEHVIYDVSEWQSIMPIHYMGWQPRCLIEFVNDQNEIVLSGYGTDH